MQTVANHISFEMTPSSRENRDQDYTDQRTISPAEFRLECQVLLGGIVASGLMLLAVHFFGM